MGGVLTQLEGIAKLKGFYVIFKIVIQNKVKDLIVDKH